MDIIKERTRIIFSGYENKEKAAIDNMVATMDKVLTYEDVDNNTIYLPPGLIESVKKLFPRHNIIDKSNTYWEYSHIEPVHHNAEPRNQLQIDFIKFLLESSNKKEKVAGILSPGTGKTFMACYAAAKIGLRTLIIVPTTNVKNQWAATLIDMFKVDKNKVVNVNSPRDFINVTADFVVVSQASLAILNKNYDLEKIMKSNKFGIKIIDEVQMWFHNIIKVDGSSNICHNWYLTGTFGRSSEEENGLFQEMFGDLKVFKELYKTPTIFNRNPGNIYGMKPHMNVKMVWSRSGLSAEEIKKITSSKRYSEREGRWIRFGISIPAYTNLIIPEDGTMTKFLKTILDVVKLANKEVTYGKMLVLTPTISSVNIVLGHLETMYPHLKIGAIHSKNTRIENDNTKASCDILVSTVKSAGTGFDVKGLSKLIISEQFKSWILTDQVSGRLRVRDDKQDTYMWDIVDSDIKQLVAWANARAIILKRKSKSFKVIRL